MAKQLYEFAGGGAATSPTDTLQNAIKEVNEYYYFVGDGDHRYAFGYIDKLLGDMLLEKYPDVLNRGGTEFRPVEEFDLSQTNLDAAPWSFEDLWNEALAFDDFFNSKYNDFEAFQKGEGFE